MSDPQGLWFASLATDDDHGRYGWPSDVYNGIEAHTVLDLAAGTGKLTALLVDRFPQVIAIEPVATMRNVLEPRATALRPRRRSSVCFDRRGG
jgi:ubiquinone/menaquinone biosynthesis C-methylase UbiE